MVYHGLSYHGKPWYDHVVTHCGRTTVYHDTPWYTMVNHGTPRFTMLTPRYSIARHTMFAGIFIHALLSHAYLCISWTILLLTDPSVCHTDRQTVMGRHVAAKETKILPLSQLLAYVFSSYVAAVLTRWRTRVTMNSNRQKYFR